MIVILDTIFQLISAFNYKENIYSWDMLLWFYVQVQDVKLRVGCKLMCTFNNIQVRCKSIIVNKTVYWLAPSFKDDYAKDCCVTSEWWKL